MKITDGYVVRFHYTLTDDAGAVIDSSEGNQPMPYLHGMGQIVPGLEQAMNGRTAGESFSVRLAPADGYGETNAALVQKVPRHAFPTDQEIVPGMQFEAQGPQGRMAVTVSEVADDEITVDANHPLAGQNLNFQIEVSEVRQATAEETSHGHVHGPGGHHH